MRERRVNFLPVITTVCVAGTTAAVEPIAFDIASPGTLPSIASYASQSGTASRVLLVVPETSSIVFVQCGPNGSQTVGEQIEAGGHLRFAAVADFTGDGLPDIVTTSPTTGRANIVRQTAPGKFSLGAVLPIGASPFVPSSADLDADGLAELIVPLRGEARVAILPNLGDGLFAAGVRLDTSLAPDSVGLADFNSDGVIDLAVTCTGSSTIEIHHGSAGVAGTSFGASSISLVTGASPTGLVVRDFDGDGFADVATSCAGSASVSVFYSDGDGGFIDAGFVFAGTAAQSIASADLDQNGLPDLIVANPSVQTVSVLQAKADRTFVRSSVPLPFRPSRVTLVDANADGRPDILATSQTSAQAIVLLNATAVTPCPGDVSGDLRVDLQDLNLVLAHFATTTDRGDANGDGEVTLADLNVVLANFGSVCGKS